MIINLHLDFTAPALPENNQDEWPNTPGHKEPLRAVCAPQPPTVSANQRLLGTLQHKGRVRGDPVQPERGKGAEKWGTTSSHLCSGILSTKTIENVGPLCTYRHKDGSLVCTRMVLCSLSSSLLFFFLWCLYLFSLTDDFLNISSCCIADLSLQTHSPPYSLDSRAEIVTNKDKDPMPAFKVAQRLATDSGPNHAPLPLTMFPAPSQF